jgi:hypothetical protein
VCAHKRTSTLTHAHNACAHILGASETDKSQPRTQNCHQCGRLIVVVLRICVVVLCCSVFRTVPAARADLPRSTCVASSSGLAADLPPFMCAFSPVRARERERDKELLLTPFYMLSVHTTPMLHLLFATASCCCCFFTCEMAPTGAPRGGLPRLPCCALLSTEVERHMAYQVLRLCIMMARRESLFAFGHES